MVGRVAGGWRRNAIPLGAAVFGTAELIGVEILLGVRSAELVADGASDGRERMGSPPTTRPAAVVLVTTRVPEVELKVPALGRCQRTLGRARNEDGDAGADRRQLRVQRLRRANWAPHAIPSARWPTMVCGLLCRRPAGEKISANAAGLSDRHPPSSGAFPCFPSALRSWQQLWNRPIQRFFRGRVGDVDDHHVRLAACRSDFGRERCVE